MDKQLSLDEMMFFDRKPQILTIYENLRAILYSRYSSITVKIDKTQISFKNQFIFTCVSMQRVTGAPKDYLLVTFGLDYEKKSPRIAVSTEAAPNRWTHHVIETEQKEIDDELLGWIDEAYHFSARKVRRSKYQ